MKNKILQILLLIYIAIEFPAITANSQCSVDSILIVNNNNPSGYRRLPKGANINMQTIDLPEHLQPEGWDYAGMAINEWNQLSAEYAVTSGAAGEIIWESSNYPLTDMSPGCMVFTVDYEGYIVDFAIYMNYQDYGENDWSTDCSEQKWDLWTIVLHEVGHIVGLNDAVSCFGQTVMAGISRGDCETSPLALDIKAINIIYNNDNPAATVNGFSVIDGVAEWNVESEYHAAHYIVEGSYRKVGPWEAIGFSEPGIAYHSVEVTSSVYTYFRLLEIETSGREIYHGMAKNEQPASIRSNVPPSVGFLKAMIEAKKEELRLKLKEMQISDSGEQLVIFTRDVFSYAVECGIADYWQMMGYNVNIVTVDNYPSDPDSFRACLGSIISDYASTGVEYILLVGDANDWQQFNMNERGSEFWVNTWLPIHDTFIANGYPPEGQPPNDLIPAYYQLDTLSRDQNTAWTVPYIPMDHPYADTDNDGIPDIVVARLPFTEDWEIYAYANRLWSYHPTENGANSVVFLTGDLDHSDPGDGRMALRVVDETKSMLPPQVEIYDLFESDFPLDSERNTAAADLWNTYTPELVVIVSSFSNRYWPGNFFDQTNGANPWHMGMFSAYANHFPLVIAGSCGTADWARTEDPDENTPVFQKFLTEWDRGAFAWIGASVGTWQSANRVIVPYIVEELYSDPSRSMAKSFLVAIQRVLTDYADEPEICSVAKLYVFFGDPLACVNALSIPTAAENSGIPLQFALHQNVPNPFNPSTRISFCITKRDQVSLKVYNVLGQLVRILVQDVLPAGFHEIEWNGCDGNLSKISSGVYFYCLTAGGKTLTKKMVLLK